MVVVVLVVVVVVLIDVMCNLQHRRLEQVEELFRKVDDRRKVMICLVVCPMQCTSLERLQKRSVCTFGTKCSISSLICSIFI